MQNFIVVKILAYFFFFKPDKLSVYVPTATIHIARIVNCVGNVMNAAIGSVEIAKIAHVVRFTPPDARSRSSNQISSHLG